MPPKRYSAKDQVQGLFISQNMKSTQLKKSRNIFGRQKLKNTKILEHNFIIKGQILTFVRICIFKKVKILPSKGQKNAGTVSLSELKDKHVFFQAVAGI